MTIKETRDLIIETLKSGNLAIQIEEDDLNSLMNEPDGKIVVMFNSGIANATNIVFKLNENESYLINIIVRDPLRSSDALELIDSIKLLLHGLKINDDDYARLTYRSVQFQEFIPETSIYSYAMLFSVDQIKILDNNE